MSWTDKQKALAVRACRGANIENAHRELILRQLGDRAIVDGGATSTAPRLTQADFNRFMAIVEGYSGGQVKVYDRRGKPLYGERHWQRRQDDNPRLQLAYVAHRIVGSFVAEGVGMSRIYGIVDKALGSEHATLDFEDLTIGQVRAIIHAFRAVAQREGITLKAGVSA